MYAAPFFFEAYFDLDNDFFHLDTTVRASSSLTVGSPYTQTIFFEAQGTRMRLVVDKGRSSLFLRAHLKSAERLLQQQIRGVCE